MSNGLLLWIDDEIELLKAHIIFLEKKGYEVQTVSNGTDSIASARHMMSILPAMVPTPSTSADSKRTTSSC